MTYSVASPADMAQYEYYVLIKPWAVYVKHGPFFKEQGGLREPWGKEWRMVNATSIEAARKFGEQMRAVSARGEQT